MAYAPFNSGPYQGRAIRLGSSRSLKMYRGSRELGSSDPVLIIHDAFGGSGSMDGRTPDTVNNGNTWFTPQSGVSYGVTGGYSYKTAYGSLPYEDNIVIDVGTSNYTIEMSGRCADQFLAGVGIWVDGTGGTGEGIYPRWRNTQQRFLITEIVGGTATAIADKTNLGILDDRVLIAEVSGTTLTASLYNSTKTALTWKHVVDLSSSSVTPTTYVSFQSAGNTYSAPPLAYDFKVYTPPVEATSKIVWDFNGVYDSPFGAGAADIDPVFRHPSVRFSGLVFFVYRHVYGLMFGFDTSANRSAFLASYPNNFGKLQYRDTFSNVVMTTKPNWTWTLWNYGGTYRCYIPYTSINNWYATGSADLPGESYTLIAF
jgi:hypothetical protein